MFSFDDAIKQIQQIENSQGAEKDEKRKQWIKDLKIIISKLEEAKLDPTKFYNAKTGEIYNLVELLQQLED